MNISFGLDTGYAWYQLPDSQDIVEITGESSYSIMEFLERVAFLRDSGE